MADKLTSQLNKTDKKVEDISKSRLGNAYKNIINVPDYMINPNQELVSITDGVTCVLANIVDPTHFYNEYLYNTITQYNTGAGSYTSNQFSVMMSENNGSLPFLEWYIVDIDASKVGTYVTLRHTKGANSSTLGYKDIIIKRMNTINVQYRSVYDMPRDINVVDASTVDITFKPDAQGKYVVGIYNTSFDGNVRALDPIAMAACTWASVANRYHLFTRTQKPITNYDGNTDIDDIVLTEGTNLNNQGYVYVSGARGAGVTSKDVYLSQIASYGEYRTDYILLNDGSIFFPFSGTGYAKLLFQWDIVTTGLSYSVITTDGVVGSPNSVTLSTHTITCGVADKGVIVSGITDGDRDKIQCIIYKGATEYSGYYYYMASDTGSFKGKKFTTEVDTNRMYIISSSAPTVTAYKINSLGARTSFATSITSEGYNVYYLNFNQVGTYYFETNVDVMVAHVPQDPGSPLTHKDVYSPSVYFPADTGYIIGTSFHFKHRGMDNIGKYPESYPTLPADALPVVKVRCGPTGGTATVRYKPYYGSYITANVSMSAGTEYTLIGSKGSENVSIEVTSTAPCIVYLEPGSAVDTQVDIYNGQHFHIYNSYGSFISRKLFPPSASHQVAPISVGTVYPNDILDNYDATVDSWQKDFDVTTSFDGSAMVTWGQFNPQGQANISCFVRYSDDGTTFGPEYSVTNGVLFPTTGLTANTRKIRVRFEIPSSNWIYNIKLVYYTWQAI